MIHVKFGGKSARGFGLGSSSAAAALSAVNPCDQANVALVCDFQKSVQQPPDGKYGTDTAHALVRQIPTAPSGCHPRPAWWAAHGKSNCGQAQTVVQFPADIIVGHRQPTEVAGSLPQMPGFPGLPQVPYQVSPWVSLIPGALTPVPAPVTPVPAPAVAPGSLPGQNLPGQYLPGQLGDPAQGDTLFTATQTLLTALANSPGYPTAISCGDTNVAAAAGAFQSAFNASAIAGNTTAPNTGAYDAATQLALQSTINTYQALTPPVSFTSGSAARPCVSGARRVSHSSPPPAPPVDLGEIDPTPAAPVVSTDPSPAPPVAQTQPLPPAPPLPPGPPSLPAPPVETTEYVVQTGDSPEIIARRLGVPFHELIRANPHKPTRLHERGFHTWHTLVRGERLRVPVRRRRGGRLGDGQLGAQVESIDELKALLAAKRHDILVLLHLFEEKGPSWSLADPNGYARWKNDFEQLRNRYEQARVNAEKATNFIEIAAAAEGVYTAIRDLHDLERRIHDVPITNVQIGPAVLEPPVVPSVAQALAAVNPCDRANAGLVRSFQQSVGKESDGKYGHETAQALAALVPNAPAACAHQSWWGSAPPPYSPPPPPAYVPPAAPVAQVPPVPPSAPATPPAALTDAPATHDGKGLSTGAIVAGGIGAAALIGIVAAVLSGPAEVRRESIVHVGEKKGRRR